MGRLLTFFFFLGLAGCATIPQQSVQQPISQQVQQIEKYEAKFDYTTPGETAAPHSAEVTFAIENPRYAGACGYTAASNYLWITSPEFTNLHNALQQDLSEIILAKGFSLRGPYNSYDLIPFSDKKSIDLLLTPIMELSVTLKDPKQGVESIWTAPPVAILTGNVNVSGKITLEAREIVTRELMWIKTIPFKKFTFSYRLRIPAFKPPFPYALLMKDVAKGIEQQYPDVMATIYNLVDPEEMQIIKKQAQELKNKKGY